MIFRFLKKIRPPKSEPSTDTGASRLLAEPEPSPPLKPPPHKTKDYSASLYTLEPHVVVVDDGCIFLAAWELELRDIRVSCFEQPHLLFQRIDQDQDFLKTVSLIIIDHSYGTRSKYNGQIFANELRKSYAGPLFLSTEIPLMNLENIDMRIGKHPLKWGQLKELISESIGPT